MIVFSCPQCQNEMSVEKGRAGEVFLCPQCERFLEVPQVSEFAPSPVSAVEQVPALPFVTDDQQLTGRGGSAYVRPSPQEDWLYGVDARLAFQIYQPDTRKRRQLLDGAVIDRSALGSNTWFPMAELQSIETINRPDGTISLYSRSGKKLDIFTGSLSLQQECIDRVLRFAGARFESKKVPVPWRRVSPVANAMIVLAVIFTTILLVLSPYLTGGAMEPTRRKDKALAAILSMLGPWGILAAGAVVVCIQFIYIVNGAEGLHMKVYTRKGDGA